MLKNLEQLYIDYDWSAFETEQLIQYIETQMYNGINRPKPSIHYNTTYSHKDNAGNPVFVTG